MTRRPASTGSHFAILATFVVGTVVVLLVLSALDEIRFSRDRIGIDIAPHEQGILITGTGTDMPAEQAGIQPEDILIRINGQLIDSLAALDAAIADHADRDMPHRLVVLRDNQELELELKPGVPPDIARLITQLILVGAYLGIAVLTARYRNKDLRARLLMFFVTLVAVELALPSGYTFPVVYFYSMLMFWLLATGIQIALELHLVSLIPERLPILRRRPWLVRAGYVIGLGIGVGLSLLALQQWFARDGQPFSPILSRAENTVLTGWALVVSAILLWQIRQARTPRGRNQALLILIGLTPWVIYTLVSIYWSGWDDLNIALSQHLANIALLFFPAAVFVAIFRYGLFDVENLVRRGLIYGVIAAFVLILLYTLITTALPWISGRIGDDNALWLVTGAAVLTGILFRPLRSGIERLVERGLFPERQALRRRLIQIAASLSNEEHMKDLVQRLADETRQALGLRWVTVVAIDGPGRDLHTAFSEGISASDQTALVKLLGTDSVTFDTLSRKPRPVTLRRLTRHQPDAARALGQLGAEVLAPLYFQRRMIGILCLSSKAGGELFVREEIELLDLFSHQIAASFENLRLFQDATYEGLTGLLRREAVLRQLDTECGRALRGQTPLTVFMIDLDSFKMVNDQHGHLFGDRILEQVARAMHGNIRSVDSLGRYGGEEFLLVLPDTAPENAVRVAEKLRDVVANLEFKTPQTNENLKVTISIGIAGVEAGQANVPGLARTLLLAADAALYEAKNAGRNRVAVHDPFDAQQSF